MYLKVGTEYKKSSIDLFNETMNYSPINKNAFYWTTVRY